MDLLAEMKMRRHGVLEQVDAEVAEHDEDEGMRHVHTLGKHPDEGRRQHEPGAGGHEVAKAGVTRLLGGGDDGGAGDVRRSSDGRERQVC